MFSPCSLGFLWVLQFPQTIKICTVGISPVSTLDRGSGSEFGVGPQVLHWSCPLLLRDGLNAENTF